MTTPSDSKNQGTTPTPNLVEQVQARRAELTRALSAKETSPSTRADIEAAIAALVPMLTGDLAKLPDMVSRDLIKWLDTSKYLGANAADAATPAGAAASPGSSTASSPAIAVMAEDGRASSPAITVPSSST